jgi:hypothetical protein
MLTTQSDVVCQYYEAASRLSLAIHPGFRLHLQEQTRFMSFRIYTRFACSENSTTSLHGQYTLLSMASASSCLASPHHTSSNQIKSNQILFHDWNMEDEAIERTTLTFVNLRNCVVNYEPDLTFNNWISGSTRL